MIPWLQYDPECHPLSSNLADAIICYVTAAFLYDDRCGSGVSVAYRPDEGCSGIRFRAVGTEVFFHLCGCLIIKCGTEDNLVEVPASKLSVVSGSKAGDNPSCHFTC